jgi:hypothetical protein
LRPPADRRYLRRAGPDVPHPTPSEPTVPAARLAVVVALVLGVAAGAAAYDEETIARAEARVAEALAAYRVRGWSEAEARLLEAHTLLPHPLVEYLLACTAVERDRPDAARRFAELALGEHRTLPAAVRGLPDRYRRSAQEIVRWATRDDDPEFDRVPLPALVVPVSPSLGMGRSGGLGRGTPPWPAPVTDDVSGLWRSEDGARWTLRQVGQEVWGYGESGDGGGIWTIVLHGRLLGNDVVATWAALRGDHPAAGELVLRIEAPDRLRTLRSTGGFTSTGWHR